MSLRAEKNAFISPPKLPLGCGRGPGPCQDESVVAAGNEKGWLDDQVVGWRGGGTRGPPVDLKAEDAVHDVDDDGLVDIDAMPGGKRGCPPKVGAPLFRAVLGGNC